jgi:transcriptional regulator GlxA family with amidase domain
MAQRMENAAALLISTSLPIQDIAERTGFDGPFYFFDYLPNIMG